MGTRDSSAGAPAGGPSLVVQTSFLGDVVLTTPLIAELASRGPVDVVVTAAAAPLLAHNPHIRRLIVFDKRGTDAGAMGLRRTAARIRTGAGGADAPPTAFIAQRSLRSAALALLAGCRERVGFRRSQGTALYTRRIKYHGDLHHSERLWRLAFSENGAPPYGPERLRPRLYPGAEDHSSVDSLLGELDGEPFVALAPGSVWATKRWPHYAALARRLSATHRMVVIGGPDDAPLAREIVASVGAIGGPIIDATARLSLLGSAELIRRAAVVITNDSLPLHLASAMDTPTLAIFGPTVPAFGFGPLARGSIAAGHATLSCRPCHSHGPRRCPLGHWRCMRELDAEQMHTLVLRTFS